MMVLQSLGKPVFCCLLLRAKTRGVSKFQLGNVETTGIPLEPAKLCPILGVDHRHHIIEGHGVAFVADVVTARSAHRRIP